MQTIYSRLELNDAIDPTRNRSGSLGFVPTMGALHEGHFSLVEKALSTCDYTVVSIFVNPKQFNNSEDYDCYPRQVESDLRLLEKLGVDTVYLPNYAALFSETNPAATVDLHGLDSVLEGASRPGHFRGVVDVVYALLDHINPTHLFLGLKDFQQVLIIKNMIHDLGLPVSVVACETRREASGLAMSSRNQRLSPSQQEDAAVLYRILKNFKNKQALHSPEHLISEGIEEISRALLVVDYLAVVDAKTLSALDSFGPSAIACVAATCHGVRLIDNLPLWDD